MSFLSLVRNTANFSFVFFLICFDQRFQFLSLMSSGWQILSIFKLKRGVYMEEAWYRSCEIKITNHISCTLILFSQITNLKSHVPNCIF